jgi:hypothetical protein
MEGNIDKCPDFCDSYCTKLGCKFVSVNADSITVIPKCGHTSIMNHSDFFRRKIDVYCKICLSVGPNIHNELTTQIIQESNTYMVNCIECTKDFFPTKRAFLFCSEECLKEKTKTKIDKRKYGNGKSYTNLQLKKSRRMSIEEIEQIYKNKGCTLLTTGDEYNEFVNSGCRLNDIHFRIISSCGHEYNSLYTGFVQDNTGVICKDCRKASVKEIMSSNSKNEIGYARSLSIQKEGSDIVKKLCGNDLQVEKAHDGCNHTILVRPFCVGDCDSWLKIKIKATSHSGNNNAHTCFRIRKICDVVVLMVHIETNIIRVFLPEELIKKAYYIGKENNGYEDHIVHDMKAKLCELYNLGKYNSTFYEGNIPVSNQMKVEYNYSRKRIDTIKFLNFEQSEYIASVYNFKIRDLKFQETVAPCQFKKKSISANISKHAGKEGTVPYDEHDNDFYWFNVHDNVGMFYVVPEHELISNGFISTVIQGNKYVGKKNIALTTNDHWLNKYKFCYKTINEEKEKERLLKVIG